MVRLNAAGSALDYATFLGGSESDCGGALALDAAGRATVTGATSSSDFPTTPGAFDTSFNGDRDAFVVRLNAAGKRPRLRHLPWRGNDGDLAATPWR